MVHARTQSFLIDHQMNKQLKKNGSRGIEWTDYTWNVLGGCLHDCEWVMPDGSVAICYAKEVAERLATSSYPHGFKHHYYHPRRLEEPLTAAAGVKVFLDSMADLMGHWVPEEQIKAIFDVCRKRPDIHFQSLTKNAPRLLHFALPDNVWPGVSAPPSRMHGKDLSDDQQDAMVRRQLDVLAELLDRNPSLKTWMSIEPLSFNIASIFHDWTVRNRITLPLKWTVIGAASKGSRFFQPDPEHVEDCHRILRLHGAKIFHKGNLKWEPHLEEFPI